MESLSIKYWHDLLKTKLAGYPAYLPDIIIGFPLGFVIGFLFKTFGRFLIIGLIVTAAVLWLADYMNFITIHRSQVESLVGMQPFHSFQDLYNYMVTMVREHVAGFIALVIGFLLGCKLGL